MIDTEPDYNLTFRTTRGAFVIPAELFDDGRELDLARHYAQSMPEGATAAGRENLPGGDVRVKWRRIRIIRIPPGRR